MTACAWLVRVCRVSMPGIKPHESHVTGKAKCKAALQQELGFPVDPSKPLMGFIGRLDYQKGPDVVLEAVNELCVRGCQVGRNSSAWSNPRLPDPSNPCRAGACTTLY